MNNIDLRSIAESRLISEKALNNEKLEKLSVDEISLVVHDLQVHQIELEMQNEELLKTQAELDETKARYFDLYDLAPEGYLVVSEEGLILESNLTAAALFGVPRAKMNKQRLSQYIHKEDQAQYYRHRKELFRSLTPQECELRMIRDDGTIFWAHMKATVIMTEGVATCRLIVSDISERMQTELQLKLRTFDLLESQRIAHLGTWKLKLSTNQVVWSEELYKMYGFDPTIPPPPYTEHMKLFTPESWDKLSTSLENTRTTGTPYELELETKRSDGTNGWMWARGEAETDAYGNIVSLWGAAQEITERKEIELALIKSEEKYKSLVMSMDQGLALHEIILDANGTPVDYIFLDINDSYTRLLGVTRDMCIGKRIKEVMPQVEQYWIDIFGKVALTGEPSYYENLLATTGRYYSTYAYSPKKNQFAVLVTDIDDRVRREEEIEYLSYHDQLTGLCNRRFYEEELKRLDTERNLPLTIAMGDINGLKLINDSFGHQVGDEQLKKVAEVLKGCCRADDIIARIGGDEFVIILPKTDTPEAEKLIVRINNFTSKNKVENLDISISFGYETKTKKAQKIEDVFKGAEDHMYRHKLYESASIKNKMIEIIMNTLFEKNPREMLHSKRVSEICEFIAKCLNFGNDDILETKLAGLMHDIGKIGIEEKVLSSTGKLNEEEWKEIKRHSEVGYRILSSSNEFSEIADHVLAHHERWDGAGYPKRLKGEEISIQARIIAIADSFDAMIGERTYKQALSVEEALEEIRRCAGTQFDPEIAKVFVTQYKGSDANIS